MKVSVCYHEFGDPVLRGRRSGHLGKEGVATGRRDGSPLSMMFVSEILKESPHGFDRAGSFFVGLRAGGRLRNEPHRRLTDSLPISSDQLAALSEAAFSVSLLLRSTALVPVKSVIRA